MKARRFPRAAACKDCSGPFSQKRGNHILCADCANARSKARRRKCTLAWAIKNGLVQRPGAGRGWNFKRSPSASVQEKVS